MLLSCSVHEQEAVDDAEITQEVSSKVILSEEPLSKPNQKSFRFFINADPQMGPENTERKGMKILNELLENFVLEVNRENKKLPVDFVVYNGDLVWDPYQDAFDNFTRIVSKQEVPVKLVHGNHDGYNDDPKFFQAQKKLSGYEKLNYSFEYGNWHFVVIGAQEKYLLPSQKEKQLDWIRNELLESKDKNVMLFMHYHIMPVGLSQMEYYSYWPLAFKHEMLNEITRHGNVKYVFNGHVHVGAKAAMKSSISYQGTNFINSPTPVMARPFGEEFEEFEDKPDDRYFRRGFYMEVKVDGDDVEMVGHKIDHDFEAEFPKEFKQFKPAMDKRFFQSESKMKPNQKLRNPNFKKGFKGWNKSYRYKKDQHNAFKNKVRDETNILRIDAPWGSWSFDEYMETYQLVELELSQPNQLHYEFDLPTHSNKGGGGFIKLIFYSEKQVREKMVLLHWGAREEFVKKMPYAFLFNADGDRASVDYIDNAIKNKHLLSYPLAFDGRSKQLLSIDINAVLNVLKPKSGASEKINKISISHGVWSRVKMKESDIFSELKVSSVKLGHSKEFNQSGELVLNNKRLNITNADNVSPFFRFTK